MGDLIIFLFAALCSISTTLVLYFFAFKRFSRMPKRSLLLFFGIMVGSLTWFLIVFVPKHNAKNRIVQYAGSHYGVTYSDVEILERTPGEGEILTFSDNETGAIAFRSVNPISLNVANQCHDLNEFHWVHELKETVPSGQLAKESWSCVWHRVHDHDGYRLLYNRAKNVYILAFSWSFG